MNVVKSMLLVLVPAFTWAFLCDETYYLQSVSQTIYSGSDPKNMTDVKRKTVKPDLSDLDILDTNMIYKVMVKFEGACSTAIKPVTFKVKPAKKKTFLDSVDLSYQVRMYDSAVRVEGFKYDYWFGFFRPKDSLAMTVGRTDSQSDMFVNWYVAIVYTDSIRKAKIDPWERPNTRYYSLIGPYDSLVLEKLVLDETIRKVTVDDNHKGVFSYQFLKVSFDSKVPARLRSRKNTTSRFQASQTGNLVLIDPGEKSAQISEPLNLYGMMGNKVATLHPTGYIYQWNGKTSLGADAPAGIYFVQSSGRILGKFFYTR